MAFDKKNVIVRNMRRIILVCLLLFFAAALVSCGSGAGIGGAGGSDEGDGFGAISFGVDWKDAPKLGLSLDSSSGMSRAAIDCSASGVATVSASVYDSSGAALASGGPWSCNSHGGLITGVKAGASRKVVLMGNDSDGKVKHRGELSGVTVQAGGTASADTLTAVSFVPALTTPANGATVTNGAYSFSWIGSGGALSYRIQASASAGFSSTAIDTTVSSTSYTPSTTLSGQYYWRVRAIDAMGHEGAWSVVYSCTVSGTQGNAPSAPTGVNAAAGDAKITVSWSAVTGATSYNIYYSASPVVSKTSYSAKINTTATSYQITELTNGTAYYVVVTALNGYGESAESTPTASATPAAPIIDNTPPTVSSTSPANNATGVAVNGAISVTFSEAMSAASITSATFTMVGVSGTVTYSGTTATFTPSASLAYGTTYTANISTGAKDAAGNALSAGYSWSFTTGPAPDTTPPTVSSTSPANNATGVAVNSAISATFSEAMSAATISTATFSIAGVSGTVTYSGTTATFTPSVSLNYSTTYTATITTGVKDNAGNAMSGNYSWSFTTGAAPDNTPPTVSSTDPANGSTGISVNRAISVTFSEAMDAASITNATFTITGVSGTVSYANKTASFTPSWALSYNTTYTASVSTWVRDAAGNTMTSNHTWSFRTGDAPDTTPPTVSSTSPASNATFVNVNGAVTVTFSEAMDATSITTATFTITGVSGTVSYANKVAVFTPSAPLVEGTAYTATMLKQVKDVAGNAMTANYSWSFTTGESTPPTVPAGLAATAAAGAINLAWSASSDNAAVTGYNVYKGGVKIATATAASYSDTGLLPLTQYCYTVSAYDGSGNESGQSAQACATTNDIRRMKVPDTGQTASYTTTFGEDHDYTINPPSYTINGDGTVTDNVTGLMWQRTDDGTTRTWADAGTYCDNLALAGYTDWRLPEVKELTDIVDDGKNGPAIDTAVFPGTLSSYYWSSTTFASNTSYAWYVDIGYGGVYGHDHYKSVSFLYVRCVRGEKATSLFTENGGSTVTDNVTGLMWQKQDDGTGRTWEQAISYCEALYLGGKADWRLPNIKELKSIADHTKFNPAIDTAMFPGTQSSYYWSSTRYAPNTMPAWGVLFNVGSVGSNQVGSGYDGNYVRCVRGGQ